MNKKITDILENVVIAAILLVLIQTFLEDLAVLLGFTWAVRSSIILAGFFFDLFFTVEFITRLVSASKKGMVREYIFLEKGWIDFMASIPLLVFNSGPIAAAILFGGGAVGSTAGILNILKVIKAVRIARVLRLLRVLKIFKQIKNAESEMAQRHVSKIAAMGVSVFVFILFITSIISQITGLPSAENYNKEVMTDVIYAYSEGNSDSAEYFRTLLIVKENNQTLFSRYGNDFYSANFGFNDYTFAEYGNYQFFFDNRQLEKIQSRDNLVYFILIVGLVVAYTLFYSPHFAITISDPVHVMRRGLSEKSYNFEVKIPADFKDDDIFRLASEYNKVFLPMKDRSHAEESSIDADSLELKMDDIKNLF